MNSVLMAAKIPTAPKSVSVEKNGVGTSVGDERKSFVWLRRYSIL